MIGQATSHDGIIEKFGVGGMGIVYKAQKHRVNRLNWFKLSPKGIDISTEGNALGLDLPSTRTTLKGLNT